MSGPEQRDEDRRVMAPQEVASFLSAYHRARKKEVTLRGEPTKDVRTAQAIREAFVKSAARELRIDV